MSQWAYVHGTIVVSPMGRSQPEKRYILDTVLEHLPRVTGSEGDMDVYVIQKAGFNSSSSVDEFGNRTDNLTDWDGNKSYRNGWHRTQTEYILVVDGSLRDRTFAETKRSFLKWLCRLAKRVSVSNVQVHIESYDGEMMLQENMGAFWNMREDPSWVHEWNEDRDTPKEPNWCEFMMWEPAKDSCYPIELTYKYFENPENDAEFERRYRYHANKLR